MEFFVYNVRIMISSPAGTLKLTIEITANAEIKFMIPPRSAYTEDIVLLRTTCNEE